MIQKKTVQRWLAPTVFGLVLAGSMAVSQAQTFTNFIFCQFDTSAPRQNGPPDNTSISLVEWWGDPTITQEWDGTMNALTTLGPNNAGSGSLKVTVNWAPNQNQLVLWQQLNGVNNWWDPSVQVNGLYYDLSFDIRFDPSSCQTASGDYGNIQVGLSTPSWNQLWIKDIPHFPVTNNWVHVNCPIDPTLADIDQITAFILAYPWQPNAITNTQIFWLDNIIFQTNLNKNLQPPTLTLTPSSPTPGLHFVSPANTGEYDREDIGTVSGNYSWVGAGSAPVTYSLTIGNYPGTNNPYFQTQIFLVSGANGAMPGNEDSPDWNEPNCIFLQIQNDPDGSAFGRFMWKTNDADDNTMLWNTQPGGPYGTNGFAQGTIGTLTEPAGILGKWSIAFMNDTNVTLTSPSGLSTNFSFPDDMALQANFPQGATVAYFGGDPNATANIGLGMALTDVKIAGPASQIVPIDDNFSEATLDPTIWNIFQQDANGVMLVPAGIHWSLSWTLPDLHFTLQAAPSITGPWANVSVATNAVQSGQTKSLLVPDSALPSKASSYFRMLKSTAAQLQVLMPGETAAPGTATGKTGTPDPEPAGNSFNVIVNAVDANWNLVNGVSDTIAITSSDPGATLPPNGALSGGTGTFVFYFGTSGTTQTVTATDVTNPSVAPNTGSPTVVQ